MYSQDKVVYANTNVGQHVHFHDHTYSYKQSYTHVSHVKMKFLHINLLILHIVRHSHNVNNGNDVYVIKRVGDQQKFGKRI